MSGHILKAALYTFALFLSQSSGIGYKIQSARFWAASDGKTK
jgi:hypothetical protein